MRSRNAYTLLTLKRLAWSIVVFALTESAFAKSAIQSNYDKFKDVTTVSTKPLLVANGWGPHLTLSFSYICKGNSDSCHPDRIFAVFDAVSFTGLYTNVHSVTFLADGARIVPVEKEMWDSHVRAKLIIGVQVYETIIAEFTVEDFLRVARASDVEGEVGPTQFKAKEKQLKIWRELAEKIAHE